MTNKMTTTERFPQQSRAFTLVEILVVSVITAALVAAVVTSEVARLKKGYQDAEDRTLSEIQHDMIASLDSGDYSSVDTVYTQTSAADWFAKIATMRGTTFTAATPTRYSQPQLAAILFNRYQRSRIVIPCPLNETNQQRFLVCSLLEDPKKLQMPAYDGTDNWFEAVWNMDWTNSSNTVPGYIAALMSAAQVTAWNGSNGVSLLPAFRVVKVTVPKFTFVVSNTSTINNAYVYYNNDLNSFVSLAGSGPTTSPPILQGRLLHIYTGQTQGTAILYYQRWLRKNEDITLQ
jgi:type II secretory pathway pseudopilin PulG